MEDHRESLEHHEDPIGRLEEIGRLSTTPTPPPSGLSDEESFHLHSDLDAPLDEDHEVPADQALALELFDLINHQDIWNLTSIQTQVLDETRLVAWQLGDFVADSSKLLSELSKDYEGHVKAIKEMKKDLDSIFKRTRAIKALLYNKYPQLKFVAMEGEEEE